MERMKYALIVTMLMTVPLMALTVEEAMEESGESGVVGDTPQCGGKTPPSRAQVLLVPNSTTDAVGMFDINDGTYLGDFIVDDPTGTEYDLQTPINAIEGPGGMIFVSDQISDAVYAFDNEGNFAYTAALTGLNNVRGIAFRDDTLFVTSGDDYIAMFSDPDVFAGYFIQDGSDPFDILFVDEVTSGSAIVSDIQGTTDNVRHYDADGTLLGELFSVLFPEQVQVDIANPGNYLAVSFSDNTITQFQIDGTIVSTIPFTGGRGVYRLGNGNLLATNGTGVHEINPTTGAIIETEFSGSGRFIELADVTYTGTEEDTYEPVFFSGVSMSPNPFAETLSIGVTLPSSSGVTVTVYALDGRVVGNLEPGVLSHGNHTLEWNAAGLENGVYLVKVSTPGATHTEKVQLLN
jgi:hypothetical protein